MVESWEQKDTKQLSLLFSNYLYPIRQWSNGKNGMYYSKLRVPSFKGVSLQGEAYAFQQGLNLIHNTVDSYNQHPHRRLDTQTMTYPFQLTQTIINDEIISYNHDFSLMCHGDNCQVTDVNTAYVYDYPLKTMLDEACYQ